MPERETDLLAELRASASEHRQLRGGRAGRHPEPAAATLEAAARHQHQTREGITDGHR